MGFSLRYPALIAAAGICVAAPIAMTGMASAELPASALQTPAMQALMHTPDMQKALAALHKGDARSAVPYLRAAIRQRNPFAYVILARMYDEGRGVQRDYIMSLKLLKLALLRHHQEVGALAEDTLHTMAETLRHSPNESDRQLAFVAAALPPAAMLPQGAPGRRSAAGEGSVGENSLIHGYVEHQLFDELTDHDFDPFYSPPEE